MLLIPTTLVDSSLVFFCNSLFSTCRSLLLQMEKLIQEMQHPDLGVPLRSQKLFLTSIPSAFVGYDVVEWIMDNLDIEDQTGPVAQEALHLANLLCQYGYFFPVGDNAKTYTIKDDSTLYRCVVIILQQSANTRIDHFIPVYFLMDASGYFSLMGVLFASQISVSHVLAIKKHTRQHGLCSIPVETFSEEQAEKFPRGI